MDERKRFLNIKSFLLETKSMWEDEIIFSHPHCFNSFPYEWVLELMLAPEAKLEAFASHGETQFIINKQFKEFLLTIRSLSEIPSAHSIPLSSITNQQKIPYLHVKGKKEHEIKSIFSFIKEKRETHFFDTVVDHCGGKGNLSHNLCQFFSQDQSPDFISIDYDPQLIQLGQKQYFSKQNPVFYLKKNLFTENVPHYLKRKNSNQQKMLSLGLHTCGKLAVEQIHWAKETQATYFLNFGCCYSRLHDEGGMNISKMAWESTPLVFGQAALTLASHCNHPMTSSNFRFKIAVKKFRYGFFLFLKKHHPEAIFLSIGNSKRELYFKDFACYAQEQLLKIGRPLYSAQYLNNFFNHPSLQEEIKQMIVLGIIRGELGRLIEISILLDRLFYLEESRYSAQILTFFDRSISPRNIGLWAKQN